MSRGQKDELEDLFRRELPPLRRWAFAHVPSSVRRAGDTDDFVQLAILRTLRRLPLLRRDGDTTLQSYMRRVLVNLVRDYTRANGRRPGLVSLEDEDAPLADSQLSTMIAAQTYARYRAAVTVLSPRERTALVARIERGLPYEEVARRARCASAGAARVMVGRALRRVHQELRTREDGRARSRPPSTPPARTR